MNKVTPSHLTSQVLNTEIISDPIGFLREACFTADQLIIKLFATNLKKHKIFDYSHAYIAKVTGLSIRTVQRSIKRLIKHGILESIWRPYNTCIYLLHDFFKSESLLSKLKWFFVGLFSLSSLVSEGGVRLLILKEVIYKCTGTNSVMSNNIAAQDLYLSPAAPWLYSSEKGEPNKKMTFEQFEAQFFKKEQYMNTFTQDQLQQLAQYPKETLSYATKMLTKDMGAGKTITNQFAYFKSICERHKNKTPEMGKPKATSRPVHGPQSIFKQEERIQETDYEFAYNVERVLHNRMLNDNTFHKGAARIANPKWKLITLEEQQFIMSEIHVDCNCRQLVDRSLHDEPFVIKKETTSGMDWNSLVPAKSEVVTRSHTLEPVPMCTQCGKRPEWKKGICAACTPGIACTGRSMGIIPIHSHDLDLVSDNTPDFMSEQYLGDQDGEFQEVLD